MARKRRQLSDEEVEALRELLSLSRERKVTFFKTDAKNIGAIAALIAAVATFISAVTASVLSVLDRILR